MKNLVYALITILVLVFVGANANAQNFTVMRGDAYVSTDSFATTTPIGTSDLLIKRGQIDVYIPGSRILTFFATGKKNKDGWDMFRNGTARLHAKYLKGKLTVFLFDTNWPLGTMVGITDFHIIQSI